MKQLSIHRMAGILAGVAFWTAISHMAFAQETGVVRIRSGSPEQVIRISDRTVIRGQSPQNEDIQQVGLFQHFQLGADSPDCCDVECCQSGCCSECQEGHKCCICEWFKKQFAKFRCNCAENRLCLMEKFGWAPEGGCTMDDFVYYDADGTMQLDYRKIRAYRAKCYQVRLRGGRRRGERVVMRNGKPVHVDRHGRIVKADRENMSRVELMHARELRRKTCREHTEKYGRPLATRMHTRLLHSKLNYFIPRGGCGAGAPFIGHYNIVYPVNPWYGDRRDGGVYAAEGVGGPVSVPLAPIVRHTYNYSWGLPSSRLTPVSHLVPAPVPTPYGPYGGLCGPYGCPTAYAQAQPMLQPNKPTAESKQQIPHPAPAPPDPTGTSNSK